MRHLLLTALATAMVYGGCGNDDSDNQDWSITVPCETGFHITVGSDTWDLSSSQAYCGDYSGEGANAEFWCEGGKNSEGGGFSYGSGLVEFTWETMEPLFYMGYIQGTLEHEVIGDKITGNFIGSGEVYKDDESEPSIKDVEICFKGLSLIGCWHGIVDLPVEQVLQFPKRDVVDISRRGRLLEMP